MEFTGGVRADGLLLPFKPPPLNADQVMCIPEGRASLPQAPSAREAETAPPGPTPVWRKHAEAPGAAPSQQRPGSFASPGLSGHLLSTDRWGD
ncbi:hypothetical protein JCM13580A_42400 [Streptomyces drozdowiczii]